MQHFIFVFCGYEKWFLNLRKQNRLQVIWKQRQALDLKRGERQLAVFVSNRSKTHDFVSLEGTQKWTCTLLISLATALKPKANLFCSNESVLQL